MTIRITTLFAAALALYAPAFAQVAAPLPVETAEAETELVRVRLVTTAGDIVLALDRGRAPITTANLLAYIDKGFLDGQNFYRVMPFGEGGIVQGGVRDGNKLLPPIAHEPTGETGILHTRGTVSMAHGGPGTARNDFFILTTDIPGFDADEGKPGYAAFGHVVEGMDVVEAIAAMPVDPDAGDGALKGQLLAEPVTIERAERVED
ncbi:peptidylprolyl isomerase [Sphingomicrobium nitratireducens]|uniref:peptidylprolyl isomerase n=1 Tax=Sphingomicrobium nitratireducens TaxID=2964666 RepID=UPI00223F0699|nr:peptidylprolyl isomerase [Sphingomicrobium nitratireducens]